MPIVAAALTYGSFGDVLETAKLAKRIIDVLRSGGGSERRQALISTLRGLCDDMAKLASVVGADMSSTEGLYLASRLSSEVSSCRALMDQFSTRINYTTGVLGRVFSALFEERELVEWRGKISARRHALQLLLGALNSLYFHEIGDQLGRVGSQVQYVGSRVESVGAQVQNIGVDVRNVGLIVSTFLSEQVSRMESDICQVGSDVERMMRRMDPHGISDPVFFVTDPIGRTITIQLAHCESFEDLDRILKAHLYRRPGGRYVERGDYRIVCTKGTIIPASDFPEKMQAGTRFDISILQRRWARPQGCPRCNHVTSDLGTCGWIHCVNPTCGTKFRLSGDEKKAVHKIRDGAPPPMPDVDNAEKEDDPKFFLVHILYSTGGTFEFGQRIFYWNGAGKTVYGTVQRAAIAADGARVLEIRIDPGTMSICLPASCVSLLTIEIS